MMKQPIKMVDLATQYAGIKSEIDSAIQEVLNSTQFVKGPQVKAFEQELAAYHGANVHAVSCGNGTDALQIALMALGLKAGDEVILPAFTYTATAEVLLLLGLEPVFVDVDPDTFVITPEAIDAAITPKTKVILPVHLFGQCAPMDDIRSLARTKGLWILEDNAQSIGADYYFSDGTFGKAGVLGTLGTTSFFPSKNLGAFGDAGAITTTDSELAEKCRMIANHGQSALYQHELVGLNSRMDTLQAAILQVKLKHLPRFLEARRKSAAVYRRLLEDQKDIQLPVVANRTSHVYHQYTLKVPSALRDGLKQALQKMEIPTMVYYPQPLYRQPAYRKYADAAGRCPVSENICKEVLSLPMHTELEVPVQEQIAGAIITCINHLKI